MGCSTHGHNRRDGVALEATLVYVLAGIIPAAFICFAQRYVGHLATVRSVDYYPLLGLARRFDAGSLHTWVNGLYPIGYPLLLRWGLAAGLNAVQLGNGLSAFGGILMLLGTYLLAYRLAGSRWLALVTEGFLGTTGLFLYFSTIEGNDVLSAGLQTLSLAIVVGLPERKRAYAAAGVLAGLAYMIRYTAVVTTGLCLLFLLGWAIAQRRRSLWAAAALFLGGFLVGAALQLVPSLIVQGNPFYSVQGHTVWWHVTGREVYVTEWDDVPMSISLLEVFLANPARFIRHWWSMAGAFLVDPKWLILDTPLRLLSQAGLLFTLLAGRSISAPKRWLLALYALGYLAALSLIRLDPRYVVPLLPISAFCAVYFLWTIIPRNVSLARFALPVRPVLLVVLLGWSGVVPFSYLRNSPQSDTRVIGVANTLRAGGMERADEVLSSAIHFHDVSVPSRTRYVQSYWAAPDMDSIDDLHALARERGYRFILYDSEDGTLAHPGLAGLLNPESRPQDLTPMLIPDSRKYALYRIEDSAAEPSHTLNAQLDDGIALVGYDLYTTYDAPEEDTLRLGLFLYWQATAPISRSYKVFVHVLDADGRLVTQDDSLPALWTYGTDRWEADEIVIDFHGLLLPPDPQPGAHTIQVGMYDEATTNRLSVLSSAGAPIADQVLLTEFTVAPNEKGGHRQ